MDFENNKLEWGMALFAAVFIGGIFHLFGSMSGDAKAPEAQDVVYEMPRPKSDLVGEFDLEGREIDRRYVNPFDKKKAQAADDAKKKDDAAKNAAKTAEAKKKTVIRKKKVDVDVVDAANDGGLSGDQAPEATPQAAARVETAKNDAAPADDQNNKDQRSPDQWKALLSGQPTKENMNKLVEALGKGEADEATFYEIIGSLLKSQKKDSHALAFYGLNSVPTAKSFAFVVQAESTLSADVKPTATQYLNSFAQPSRLSALAQAMQGNDGPVAVKAAQVVSTGVQQLRSGQGSTNPREVRGELRSSSLEAYARFIPIFQRWAQSSNQTYQQIANSLLPQLQGSQAGRTAASSEEGV